MSIDIFDEIRKLRAQHDAHLDVFDDVIAHLTKLQQTDYIGDLYRTDYDVEGEGAFPHDMLRYTSSWPGDEASAIAVGCDRVERRTVRLSKYHRDPETRLAEDRWQSKFGWRVVRIVDTMKL